MQNRETRLSPPHDQGFLQATGRNEEKREELQTPPPFPFFPHCSATEYVLTTLPRKSKERARARGNQKLPRWLLGPGGGSDVTGTHRQSFHAIPPPFRFWFPGRGPEEVWRNKLEKPNPNRDTSGTPTNLPICQPKQTTATLHPPNATAPSQIRPSIPLICQCACRSGAAVNAVQSLPTCSSLPPTLSQGPDAF